MKAIEIIKAISLDGLQPNRFGIAEGQSANLEGFYSCFGVSVDGSFKLDDDKYYFYYYGVQNECFMFMPIQEALVFKNGRTDALYLWPID